MPFHCVENLYLMTLDLSNRNWQAGGLEEGPKRRFVDVEKEDVKLAGVSKAEEEEEKVVEED